MASVNRVAFSNSHSTIGDIGDYYVDSENALKFYYDFSKLNVIPAKFLAYTEDEFYGEFRERKTMLERMCSFEVLAAIEASMRIDYLLRCQRKMKDHLSRELRKIYGKKENKASLVDDIIPAWRQCFPEHKTRMDALAKALDFRNWLAHGRYWLPKKSPHIHHYDYLTVYILASDIFSNMDLQVSASQ